MSQTTNSKKARKRVTAKKATSRKRGYQSRETELLAVLNVMQKKDKTFYGRILSKIAI
ncbi:MAG: hypothetical protein Phyf2KO_00710 [Phycisphaerales bacterium]